MIVNTILAKVIGTQNERDLKKLRPLVAEINAFEPQIQALTDDQLLADLVRNDSNPRGDLTDGPAPDPFGPRERGSCRRHPGILAGVAG